MNKFVIFDLDGTLFDSMKFWDGVGREFLKRYGIKSVPDDFNKKVKSMSVAQSCAYFRDTFGVDETPEFIADSMRDMVTDKYRYEAEFKPNVRNTLDILYNHGVSMCIATATYRELVDEALTRLNAHHYFKFILSCNDVGFGKDNPKIFEDAMARLGGNKDNTVIVEDALHAIITAKSVGFKVVAVEDSHQELNKAQIVQLADCYTPIIDADTILNI